MKRCILYFIAVLLVVFVTAGGAQAVPFSLSENSSQLPSDNVWSNGEVYTFLGGSIDLDPGQYDLTYGISGKVWAKGILHHGWEASDKLFIKAYLDDSLIGSKPLMGLEGEKIPFDFSLGLDFDLAAEGELEINVYSVVSHPSELWRLDNAMLSGTFERVLGFNPGGAAQATPIPEPATMLLLGTGLLGLATIGRKKLFRK